MGLELLPAELQLEIFNYLDNVSLKAARAVSRKLNANASPALFRSVVACARYCALGAFQKISLDSVLQKYVKEIVFDGSLYNNTIAHNESVYERRSGECEHLRVPHPWYTRPRWKRYKQLYIEQDDLKASGVLLQTLARALEWTTNVTSIVYSPHPHLIPMEKKTVRDLIPRGLSDSSHIYQNPAVFLDHPFRSLIGAIYVSQYTGVRELRVEPLRHDEDGTTFDLAIFDFPNALDFKAGQHLFNRLETCELNFKSWVRVRELEIGENQNLTNLSKMLATADNLRRLAIRFTECTSDQDAIPMARIHPGHTMISRLGLDKTWSKLRCLSLGGMHAGEEQLLDLIRRHRYTMRELSFRECSLYAGSWADVVDEVLYSTRILPFRVDLVRETAIPMGDGTSQSTEDIEEWRYEGHVELSKEGERSFVDVNPAKISVYHRRSM